ncbi:RNA-directed DNA polymerase from mobile element jockey [Trichonephila clavipes]|nr:RNA-directed DNA polymerase from mobile element jockey [Trichonephila clavipes]
MSSKSHFAIQKALAGICGEPKSIKRLRSGDLLIETNAVYQTMSFLLAKTFLNSPLIIIPHKTLNSCRGVISEHYLFTISESEIIEGFSHQGVIQRFGHSQTSYLGQLTCSRCPSVGNASTDCSIEPKCINCSESHHSDSKLCSKWKLEKKIQEIKKQEKISPGQREARKLILLQISQAYSQATKSSTTTTTTQTNDSIIKTVCAPLQTLISVLKPTLPSKIPTVTNQLHQLRHSSLSEYVPTTSNSEHSKAPEIPQCL